MALSRWPSCDVDVLIPVCTKLLTAAICWAGCCLPGMWCSMLMSASERSSNAAELGAQTGRTSCAETDAAQHLALGTSTRWQAGPTAADYGCILLCKAKEPLVTVGRHPHPGNLPHCSRAFQSGMADPTIQCISVPALPACAPQGSSAMHKPQRPTTLQRLADDPGGTLL